VSFRAPGERPDGEVCPVADPGSGASIVRVFIIVPFELLRFCDTP
jgi:hypothetical protein